MCPPPPRAPLTATECQAEEAAPEGGKERAAELIRVVSLCRRGAEAIVGCLRVGEDPVSQHYALKALENILGKSELFLGILGTFGVAQALMEILDPQS